MQKKVGSHVAAMAVYLPHQWSRWLATAEDAENLEDTWEEWYEIAQKAKVDLALHGIRCVEIPIDLDEFEKYCLEHNLKNNASERAGYAAKLLSERNKTVHEQNKKAREKRSHKKKR